MSGSAPGERRRPRGHLLGRRGREAADGCCRCCSSACPGATNARSPVRGVPGEQRRPARRRPARASASSRRRARRGGSARSPARRPKARSLSRTVSSMPAARAASGSTAQRNASCTCGTRASGVGRRRGVRGRRATGRRPGGRAPGPTRPGTPRSVSWNPIATQRSGSAVASTARVHEPARLAVSGNAGGSPGARSRLVGRSVSSR